jgi:pimeloyl-ACP methyl ester carboxylesterase
MSISELAHFSVRLVLPRAVLRMNLKPAYVDPKTLTDPLLDQHHDLLRAPGVGHLPQEESPDRALEPVRAFLAN